MTDDVGTVRAAALFLPTVTVAAEGVALLVWRTRAGRSTAIVAGLLVGGAWTALLVAVALS
ncbi:hypothetical protein C5C31_12900 [Rathayibacter rathayi]|uniref:Uncharacterized protein n=1 Tax=Rathayibacter rathayi TaxID=33887 RepID=A0ABD6W5P7_RATRA|nr:hypothetical protein [Rathayibacter rathayi]AZZ49627.1 hypothetical protein C1O28_10890 [Rathayibacter rathayi]MWV75795.1 hypothetical protein [Rathayibacter rathayi NCPPB 2980 = VKM Ac-1601]PPF10896.1 hypothetical protein C5C04_12810 [Rathayibacter rathayi]PPF24174.1 hypothetical protein C5C34_06435 [Rathayibacter rathayi]PPF44363.1 hypothetical protein C5C08_13250 [Rathayibacter rathayi]